MMSKALSGKEIENLLKGEFKSSIESAGEDFIYIQNNESECIKIFTFLKDSKNFDLLNSVTSVDFIDHFCVVYRLTSITQNETAVIKIRCGEGRDNPTVSSVCSVWRGAELQEREIYDLMGILFSGHPNMKRLLLWENFEGHPLRKDFVS